MCNSSRVRLSTRASSVFVFTSRVNDCELCVQSCSFLTEELDLVGEEYGENSRFILVMCDVSGICDASTWR